MSAVFYWLAAFAITGTVAAVARFILGPLSTFLMLGAALILMATVRREESLLLPGFFLAGIGAVRMLMRRLRRTHAEFLALTRRHEDEERRLRLMREKGRLY